MLLIGWLINIVNDVYNFIVKYHVILIIIFVLSLLLVLITYWFAKLSKKTIIVLLVGCFIFFGLVSVFWVELDIVLYKFYLLLDWQVNNIYYFLFTKPY